MPTLPWTTVHAPAPAAEVVVLASRFEVRGLRHVLPFLLDALRVWGQVRRADGAVGVSLVAHPLRREFRTLSAWRDRAALDAMVRAQPHRAVMVRYRTAMSSSTFTTWTAQASTLPLGWAEADRRLAEQPA